MVKISKTYVFEHADGDDGIVLPPVVSIIFEMELSVIVQATPSGFLFGYTKLLV